MALEKKQTYLLLIVALLICFTFGAGAVAYFKYRDLGTRQVVTPPQSEAVIPEQAKQDEAEEQQSSDDLRQEPGEPGLGNVETPRVVYSDGGYLPDPLIVKKGTTVTFENATQNSMWTASDQHPSHRLYPTTGGCLGSTFDACAGTPSGASWSFRFDAAGSWNYHNHLNPANGGTIIVQE